MDALTFNDKINYLQHLSNYSKDSIIKEYAKENLNELFRITSDDLDENFEGEKVIGLIYELEDTYVVVIDSYEMDYSEFCTCLQNAQKIATDKVYELSKNI